MYFQAWVSKLTGLPVFYCENPGRLYADGVHVHTFPTGGGLWCDPLAPCGVPVEYHVEIRDYPLTVTRSVVESQGRLVLTRLDGRVIPGVWLLDTGDPETWESAVHVAPSGVAVWRRNVKPRQGTLRAITWNPDTIPDLWNIAQAREVLVFATSAPVAGVPPVRTVVVTNTKKTRVTPEGGTEFTLSWTEVPFDRVTRVRDVGAPVVSWRDYESLKKGFVSGLKYLDLAMLQKPGDA